MSDSLGPVRQRGGRVSMVVMRSSSAFSRSLGSLSETSACRACTPMLAFKLFRARQFRADAPPGCGAFQIPIRSTSPHAHVIVASVVKAGGFRVRVPGHALRDLDTLSVGQVIVISVLSPFYGVCTEDDCATPARERCDGLS